MIFIGMKPRPEDPVRDPQCLERRNLARRKLQQAENAREYERDVALLKARVRDTEGQDMREAIQDRVNAWFVEHRDPVTGEYPDLPDAEDGGCGWNGWRGQGSRSALAPCAQSNLPRP